MDLTLKKKFVDLVLTKTALSSETIENIDLLPIYNSFYFLLGQFFKHHRISFGSELKDMRYSFLMIQDSRSGKGQITKVIKEIVEMLKNKYNYNISYTKLSDFTTAGLVGTIDNNAQLYNYKHKLKPEDEDYKNPVVLGDLYNYDMLFFEEAKNLLAPNKFTENLLTVLQEALDTPIANGFNIRKKLASQHEIRYNCSASIFATTYYLKEINPVLFEQGFFQRIGIYYKTLSNEEILTLRKNILKMYAQPKSETYYQQGLTDFCDCLMKYNTPQKVLIIDNNAFEFLSKMMDDYMVVLNSTQGIQNTIMKSLSQTIIDIAIKFGGINAIINKNNVIGYREIKPALQVIRETVNTIQNKLDPYSQADEKNVKWTINIWNEMSKVGKVTKTPFVEKIAQARGLTINKARNIVDNCFTLNILKEISGDKNTRYIELVR